MHDDERSTSKFFEDMLIVIVLYQIPLERSSTWQSIKGQLSHHTSIYIHDNSSQSEAQLNTSFQVIYQHDPENSGVSYAYNLGWKKAKELGKQWLLLLDQDTVFDNTFLARCMEAKSKFPEILFFSPVLKDTEGMLSPFSYSDGRTRRIRTVKYGVTSFKKLRVANSGVLIHINALELVEGFEEKLPLDYSDIYLQEKMHRKNLSFVLVDTYGKHSFSGSTMQDKKMSILRYNVFSNSCVEMVKLIGHKNNFYWSSLKRACRLGLQFMTMRFIRIHFKIWSSQ